jgi:Domain of unknown function (DUF4150)
MMANTQSGGTDTGGPDVCKTPAPPAPAPVPIPYPNISQGATATGFVTRVLISGAPAHNMGTTSSMSNGDEPGVAGGVVSNRFDATRRHTTAAFTVLIGGKPATRLTSVTTQNNNNAIGVRSVPSQVRVIILSG